MTGLKWASLSGLAALLCVSTGCTSTHDTATKTAPLPDPRMQEAVELAQLPPITPHGVDRSGRKQTGGASYYAQHFTGRTMANGNHFNPNSNVAASKSLPLGTTAKVTNLQTGMTATIRVEDRGPYIDGRIVDVTPKVAEQLGMRKAGVIPVIVAPIVVPQPDGGAKLGAGAPEVTPDEVAEAPE